MTQAFNLSQFANKVNTSGQADLSTAVTGTLPVANGGTGAATLTSGAVLIGSGTSAVTAVAAGTSGNILTSNGTTWVSQASAGGGSYQSQLFTTPGTWTKPSSCSQVRVTVIGGGGGGSYPNVLGAGSTGGTSSFGPAVSATGGSGSNRPPGGGASNGSPGSSTVSVGTALKSGYGRAVVPGPGSFAIGLGINGIVGDSYGGSPTGSTGSPYSVSGSAMAGNGAAYYANGGNGGVGIAIVPVSAPVSVTVGAGGDGTHPAAGGAIGGAVLVEFVG